MITALALAIAIAPAKSATISISLVKKVALHALAFAPAPSGSKVAVTLENNEVRIIDAATRQTLKTLVGHPQPPYAIAWSKDGTFIATGDESARIFIWNALTGERMRTIIGHIRGIQCLSFNSSRTLLASTGKDDVLNVWNVSTGKKVAQVLGKGANLYSGTFDPKLDNLILVGTLSGGAKTYRISNDGAHVMNFLNFTNPTGQPHGVLDCGWTEDGARAVTAANDSLAVLWDMKSFKKLGTFRGHGDWVVHASICPNGKLVATSSSDRTIKVWDTKTFEPVVTFENQCAVGSPLCFTSDGKYLLATGVDDNLEFYSVSPSQAAAAVTAPRKATKPSRRRHRGG